MEPASTAVLRGHLEGPGYLVYIRVDDGHDSRSACLDAQRTALMRERKRPKRIHCTCEETSRIPCQSAEKGRKKHKTIGRCH